MFVCFIVLKYLDQSKGSGVRLLGFNAPTDPHRPNDLGSVTEPLSTCFLTCKRLVITGTIVLGVSQGSIECQAQGLCCISCF